MKTGEKNMEITKKIQQKPMETGFNNPFGIAGRMLGKNNLAPKVPASLQNKMPTLGGPYC